MSEDNKESSDLPGSMAGVQRAKELEKALADARDEVARLERAVAGAPCHEVGCDMRSVGGCNAGCGDGCGCSVPVFVCTRCGDSDYGDNEEARRTRADCAALSHNKDADHG